MVENAQDAVQERASLTEGGETRTKDDENMEKDNKRGTGKKRKSKDKQEDSLPEGIPFSIEIPSDWTAISSLPSVHRRGRRRANAEPKKDEQPAVIEEPEKASQVPDEIFVHARPVSAEPRQPSKLDLQEDSVPIRPSSKKKVTISDIPQERKSPATKPPAEKKATTKTRNQSSESSSLQQRAHSQEPEKKQRAHSQEPAKKQRAHSQEPVKKKRARSAEPSRKQRPGSKEPAHKERTKSNEPTKQKRTKSNNKEPTKQREKSTELLRSRSKRNVPKKQFRDKMKSPVQGIRPGTPSGRRIPTGDDHLESQMHKLNHHVKLMEKQLIHQKDLLHAMEHDYNAEKAEGDKKALQIQRSEAKLQKKQREVALLRHDADTKEALSEGDTVEGELNEIYAQQQRKKQKEKSKMKNEKKTTKKKRFKYDKGYDKTKERAPHKRKKSAKRKVKVDSEAHLLGHKDYRQKSKHRKQHRHEKRRSFGGSESPYVKPLNDGRETPVSWPGKNTSDDYAAGRATPDWLRESRQRRTAKRSEQPVKVESRTIPEASRSDKQFGSKLKPAFPSVQQLPEQNPAQQHMPTTNYYQDLSTPEEECTSKLCHNRNIMPFMALSLLILLVGGLLLIIFLVIVPQAENGDSSSSQGSISPLDGPTARVAALALESFLPDYTRVALTNSSSPQSRALDWLKRDPMFDNYSDHRKVQRFALAVIYFASGGYNWKDSTAWLVYGISECDWFTGHEKGFACGEMGDTIQYLSLSQNNLQGTIPPEIELLDSLKSIDLSGNEGIVGHIPSQLAKIQDLDHVAIHQVDIVGSIPSEFGLLTNLKRLHLFETFVSGAIPTELGQASSLKELFLHMNRLQMTLPTELGQLISIEKIWLDRNDLVGPLPSQLGLLENLKELIIFGNRFSGDIPPELGSATRLERVELVDNRFVGTVPSTLCSLFGKPHLDVISVDCQEVSCACGCECRYY